MASLHLWSFCMLLLWTGKALAQAHSSSGASGTPCGTDQRKCIDGMATCNAVTGECDCHNPPYAYGNGKVNCYRDNSFRTEVFNDPNVLTYNGNSIGLPIPCRYFLTHTKTELKDQNRAIVGNCTFQVYAFHGKDKGKFYVKGYDMAMRFEYSNGSEKLISVRKYGDADNGNYDYTVKTTDNAYLPNGGWANHLFQYNDPTTGLKVGCTFDDTNNLAIVEAKKCGIKVQFRPYDIALRKDQTQTPHLSYSINCAFHPKFQNMDSTVAIPPQEQSGYTIDNILLPGADREQTLVVRALRAYAAQNSPNPNAECSNSKVILDGCPDDTARGEAAKNCLFILKTPKFINCYDGTQSGEYIMQLFNNCMEIYCSGTPCINVIDQITNSGCHITASHPDVTHFVTGGAPLC